MVNSQLKYTMRIHTIPIQKPWITSSLLVHWLTTQTYIYIYNIYCFIMLNKYEFPLWVVYTPHVLDGNYCIRSVKERATIGWEDTEALGWNSQSGLHTTEAPRQSPTEHASPKALSRMTDQVHEDNFYTDITNNIRRNKYSSLVVAIYDSVLF